MKKAEKQGRIKEQEQGEQGEEGEEQGARRKEGGGVCLVTQYVAARSPAGQAPAKGR